MSSGDPVPSITEKDATGEIATLYADIRETLGVPLVNLIWGNLATVPGALSWAWQSVKPLYLSGEIQNEALALIDCQTLPDISCLPASALRAVGLDEQARQSIQEILDSYNRTNPLNILALCALLAIVRGEQPTELVPPAPVRPQDAIDVNLPALVNLDEASTNTAELVRELNRLGARGKDHILVSMPRHLAHWPGFLALYWAVIAPLDANGELHLCIDEVLASARMRGMRLASKLDSALDLPEESRAMIEVTLDDFCRHAISRMIPVVSLLRLAMPRA